MIASINPYTGETLRVFEPHGAAEIERRLALAAAAFAIHRKTSFSERAGRLRCAADVLDAGQSRLAALMTGEMGKTIVSAEAEVTKCAWVCRYYAEHGEAALADQAIATPAASSFTRCQPLGAVLAVMPWNFPLWQVFRFAAPALMAGNVGLLKHASNVPQCALAIEEILREAGFPEGVFQTLLVESAQVEHLIDDARVAAVTLTGSEPAGRAVGSRAGHQIKKTVLELGGSDPFIVMPSADLDKAVPTAVKARLFNAGQSCIAGKRFLVASAIYEEFEHRFIEGMRAVRVGDPRDRATELGPLASARILSDLESQVERAVTAGARVLTGGARAAGHRNTYQPTVLAGVPRASDVFHEEFFGPVALLFRVADASAAIRLANDSPFGLGSSVWTRDAAEEAQFIDGIEAGQVFVNAMVASDPRVPFGGVKHSGYGRELGAAGIREFVNLKSVWKA